MKKIYTLSLYMLLWVFAIPSVGQVSLIKPDSLSVLPVVSVNSSQIEAQRKRNLDSLHTNRITVKTGDSITVTAVVLDNTVNKGRFWKSLTKAIIPAFIVNGFNRKQSATSFDQSAVTNSSAFGAGFALVPAAIDVLKKNKSKAMVGLRAYDENNQLITTQTDFMTKAARKDWQELRVNYRVEKDGFIDVLAQKDSTEGLLFTKFGQGRNWLQVTKHSQPEPASSPSAGSGGGCTAWYWCTSEGCDYLGTTCDGMTPDNGNDSGNSGDDGTTNDEKCAKCKLLAQTEHDKNLTFAKTTLYTAVLAGCTYAGAQTYISFNTAGWWVNFVPGIGPAAIQALSALGGLAVDITCLVTAVQAFHAAEATVENNYYKDMRDCSEKFSNCN